MVLISLLLHAVRDVCSLSVPGRRSYLAVYKSDDVSCANGMCEWDWGHVTRRLSISRKVTWEVFSEVYKRLDLLLVFQFLQHIQRAT